MDRNVFYASEPTPQSLVKIAIVEDYFTAWSTVLTRKISHRSVCYADFYAGEGEYDEGTPSVPLRVLTKAIEDDILRERLITVFNDRDGPTVERLRARVSDLPDVERLRHQPRILNLSVGQDDAPLLQALPDCPTLTFLDPFGYKGLSLDLVEELTNGFGCECILFFNMNRISPAVSNPVVEGLMRELFGEQRWPEVKSRVSGLRGVHREQAVLEEFERAVGERGIEFMQAFSFADEKGSRTTHYVVHLCTHKLGHGIMKDIMSRKGGRGPEGFPTFHYDPTQRDQAVMPLFDGTELLGQEMLSAFAGQRLTLEQVYLRHKGPYDRSNYREAALALEKKGAICTEPSAKERPEGTFGPDVIVRFPEEQTNGHLQDRMD